MWDRPLRTVPQVNLWGGVCAGIAYKIGCHSWIIRLSLIGCTLIFPITAVIYFVLCFILPEWDDLPKDYSKVTGD